MFNYKETLQAMRGERASMQAELDKLDRAIAALQMLTGKAATARTKPRRSAQAKKTPKAKRKISAQGLRNIVQAQKRRWAKVKGGSAK